MAGCTALSITMKSHKDRRSKRVSGQEIPPHRLKDDRLPLLVITNNQEYSPLSSAAMSAALRSPSRGGRVRATCSKTWDGGPHGSHEDCRAAAPGTNERINLTGTTTVEAKSGYGLNLEDEVKQLEALRDLDALHPVDIVPTFMGAHDVPPEYRDRREEYIQLLVDTLIPEVGRRGLAEFFDIFCEPGVFSLEETRRLVGTAKAAGFKIKVHADEFVTLGGAELAAEVGATSAEHLIAVSDEGITRLAASDTAAILLPGVSFFLMMDKRAPARRLIDAGAAVALATDFNPGSSHLSSMLFVLQLGVFTLGMTVEEAVNACTGNAAYAVGRHGTVGSLEPGKKMDLLLCDIPDHVSLAYDAGRNPVWTVIKNGRVVVEDGRRVVAR
ncbi:MAG: imidazolonepropionase [Planctomycetes bacterium]|nr:imidazolonepropionase [Planctomycetota bacterium]